MEDLHCGYWVKIPKSTRAKSVPVNNGRCSACGSWDDRTDTTDTGSAANVQRPDIDLTLHDNVALITPLTDVAQTRVSEHLEHEESRWWAPPSLSSVATWARSSPAWRMRAWSS